MSNTFDTSRVGGGTYELAKDANGNYNLKSVGFKQVNKLNLPDLKSSAATTDVAKTTKDATEATIKAQTTEVFTPTNIYGGGGGDQQDTSTPMLKNAEVKEATVRSAGDATNTTYNAMSDAEKNAIATGTSGMVFDGAGVAKKESIAEENYNKALSAAQAAKGASPSIYSDSLNNLTNARKELDNVYSTSKTYSTPRTIADQNKYLGRTFTEKTTGLQKVKAKAGQVIDNVKNNRAIGFATTALGLITKSPIGAIVKGVTTVGSMLGGKLRGIDEETGKVNTQAQYEANRDASSKQSRTDNMVDRISKGKTTRSNPRDAGTTTKQKNEISAALQDSRRGGGTGNDNARVICTDLHRTGELSTKDWIRDTKFTFKTLSKIHVKGYLLWAEPTVKHMQKYPRYRKMWKHIAQHRANDIAWRLNEGKFDLLGRIYAGIGEPVCWALGNFVSDKQISKYNLTHWRRA